MDDEKYLEGFNNLLARYDNMESKLNDKKGSITDEKYRKLKDRIDTERNNIIEKMDYERNLYNTITDNEDKENYYKYSRIINGEFTEEDKVKYIYNPEVGEDYPGNDYMYYFNNFYRDKNNNITDNREIEMGEDLYNNIVNICNANNIDLKKLGITSNAVNYTFNIPHDTRAFVQFADIYNRAINNLPLRGLWYDTANKFIEKKYYSQAGSILTDIGRSVANIRSNKDDVEHKYGIDRYYLPIMSQYSDDITVQTMIAAGYKDYEIKNQRNLCEETLKNLDLTSVDIYVAEDDIKNGGQNPLTRCTDPKIKQSISNDIYRDIGETEVKSGEKYGKTQMAFVTVGDKSGTLVTIPKEGENSFYKVFIPDALPSALKETFDNNPQFRYTAKVNMWDAQANPAVPHRINIGNVFSGNIYANGNKDFEYDNGIKTTKISQEEVIEIQYGADMLKHMALNRDRQSDEYIAQYDNEAILLIEGGLANSIARVTKEPVEKVKRDLVKYYTTYYSR